MPQGAYAVDLLKAQKQTEAAIVGLFEAELNARSLLKKVDKLTDACGMSRVPPKPIAQEFVKVLKATKSKLKSKYPSANVDVKLSYTQPKGFWRATPMVSCGLKMRSVGGGAYTVKQGDTLWGIATAQYGAGGLWTEIAALNPKEVKSKGNFIMAGVTLKIPKLNVPLTDCGIPALVRKSPDAGGKKPGVRVCAPPYEINLNATRPITRIINGPAVAWKITIQLRGTIGATCNLLMGSGVTLSNTKASVEKEAGAFLAGVEVGKFGTKGVSLRSKTGASWDIKLTVQSNGTLVGSISTKKISWKGKTHVFNGEVGFDITIRAMPKVKVVDLKGRIWDFVYDNGDLIQGVALFTAAAVTLVAATTLIATPVPGDEVVCYAAGFKMMHSSMKLMKFAR